MPAHLRSRTPSRLDAPMSRGATVTVLLLTPAALPPGTTVAPRAACDRVVGFVRITSTAVADPDALPPQR